jgi:cytochrome c oxidase assembly factor CtaG
MPALPIAAFLAGALLSLLLPALLLIALVVWYWAVVARVPGPSDATDSNPADVPRHLDE